jgi:hypothetical protein
MDDPRDPIRIDPDTLENVEAEIAEADDHPVTREELAWELVEVLEALSAEEMNELVAKNVPLDTLDFFSRYAGEFAEGLSIGASTTKRLPNLMLLGYLLRVLEDRLVVSDPDDSYDA